MRNQKQIERACSAHALKMKSATPTHSGIGGDVRTYVPCCLTDDDKQNLMAAMRSRMRNKTKDMSSAQIKAFKKEKRRILKASIDALKAKQDAKVFMKRQFFAPPTMAELIPPTVTTLLK